MKLTKPQIQQLYNFTQKHFVEWYDVQTELVDHLANGIEAQWKDNPELSFEEALQLEFKKFGICGFSDVVEEKTKALNKHYWFLIWEYFKGFFKLPKIILTLFLIWGYFKALTFVPDKRWILIPSLSMLIIVPIFMGLKAYKLRHRKTKIIQKKWLFDSVTSQLGGLTHLLQIPLQIVLIPKFNYSNFSTGFLLILSVAIVLFLLTLYISIFIATPKLRKTMANQHPEYKFT